MRFFVSKNYLFKNKGNDRRVYTKSKLNNCNPDEKVWIYLKDSVILKV